MTKKRFLAGSGLIAAATLAVTLLAYDRLPARIPTHWNVDGAADGFGPRPMVYAFSAMMVLLAALWAVLPAVSPRRYEVDRFGATWWNSGLFVVALFGYMQMMLVWFLLGGQVPLPRAMLGGVALLLGALAPAVWSLVYYKRLEREGRLT
jgi:hypothetical protein